MNDNIISYCIYHYIDGDDKTYLGFISDCEKKIPNNVSQQYKYKYTFYAINPLFRPIPNGMEIYYIKVNNKYPYNIIDMRIMYDTFNIQDDRIYFIAYNKPIPNGIPLYFHKLGENILPSFDKKPPTTNINAKQIERSPIYVLKDKDTKFKCVNARCLPWKKEIPGLYNSSGYDKLLDFENCVLQCNVLGVNNNIPNIINDIKNNNKTSLKIKSNTKKNINSNKNTKILLLIFLVLLIMIIISFKVS